MTRAAARYHLDGQTVTCRYCGVQNEEEDHRCRRCGRRLHRANPQPAPEKPLIVPPPDPERPRRLVEYQAALFAAREVPKPAPLGGSADPGSSPAKKPAGLPGRPPRRRGAPSAQPTFDWGPSEQPSAHTLRSSAEASIFCGWRAASLTHRTLATLLDLSMILIGLGIFLTIFHFGGGELAFSRVTIPIFFAVPVFLALLYETLWSLSGGETPGMNWTELRLLDFDGREPDPKQRLYRVAGTLLSLFAGGMGIIWALFDEENLTWHDHISKTFPTPVIAGEQ